MKQSRLMSLVEAIANVVVGYGIAVVTQLIVFPSFGLPAHISDALAIGGILTAVSIARSFALRGSCEAIRRSDLYRERVVGGCSCGRVRSPGRSSVAGRN